MILLTHSHNKSYHLIYTRIQEPFFYFCCNSKLQLLCGLIIISFHGCSRLFCFEIEIASPFLTNSMIRISEDTNDHNCYAWTKVIGSSLGVMLIFVCQHQIKMSSFISYYFIILLEVSFLHVKEKSTEFCNFFPSWNLNLFG